MIKVVNAAAIPFQQPTKANAELNGVCNPRHKRAQELRDDSGIATGKARATFDFPDAHAKRLTAALGSKLPAHLDRPVSALRNSGVRN